YRYTQDLVPEGDAIVLGIWALFGAAALLATRPWESRSRYGSQLRYIGLVSAVCGLGFLLFLLTPWGRYQVVRFETNHLNLRMSNFEDGLRQDLSRELCDPTLGPYLSADIALLKTLAARDQLLGQPLAARVVVASLRSQGFGWNDLRALPGGRNLLMGALLAEPDPWPEQSWQPHPALDPAPEQGLACGLFDRRQAVKTLDDYISSLDGAEWRRLEPAVVALMRFPVLTTEAQRDRVLAAWPGAFHDAADLAQAGLAMRAEVAGLLSPATSVTMAVVTRGEFQRSNASELTQTLPLMARGLVHACGVETRLAEPAQADLLITLELDEVPHYDWSRPTYRTETVVTRRRGYGRYAIPQTVTESRRVAAGSEQLTEYAPIASIRFSYAGKEVVMGPFMVQWHRYFYDFENRRYPDSPDDLYGRLWPLGVHTDWFLFKRPDED
ncbi:MAG: hypothetical protein KC910_22300, partial [Candidatus Eremiobacteraeota bacterium]|nr:hypothetical protein [Candidatus Eremiobacteraeota bacterium]